jgi:hypothetical protein
MRSQCDWLIKNSSSENHWREMHGVRHVSDEEERETKTPFNAQRGLSATDVWSITGDANFHHLTLRDEKGTCV